jgi:hypothetical protein
LQGNFRHCTSFRRRGEEAPKTPGAASSVATPATSSPTTPRGRSMTTPTRMTTTRLIIYELITNYPRLIIKPKLIITKKLFYNFILENKFEFNL